MDKDTKTIDIKLPTRWEDLDNSLSLGIKKAVDLQWCKPTA